MAERGDLQGLIEALSAERRGALLLELAERYEVVRARLERESLVRDSPKALATELRRTLAAWKRRRGTPDYRDSRALAGELDEWLATVEREILPRSPALALALAEDLLEADGTLLESTDDSAGEVGARLREACLVWLRAAKATGDESDDWIDRIHALYTGDEYGTREPLLGHANLLLTETQLRALADRFQAEMRAVLGERRADERLPLRTYHLGAAIGLVADALRDPELRARSVLMYSPEPNSLQRANLAEACLEYGRPEVALTWLEGDWSGREYEQRRLLDRAYSALGDHEKLVEIRRRSFEATGSRDSLRAWLEILPEPERVEATRYARERVVRAEPITAAESLLELGDVAGAAATIVERRTEVDGGCYSRLVSLAEHSCRARRAACGHGGLPRAPGKHSRPGPGAGLRARGPIPPEPRRTHPLDRGLRPAAAARSLHDRAPRQARAQDELLARGQRAPRTSALTPAPGRSPSCWTASAWQRQAPCPQRP